MYYVSLILFHLSEFLIMDNNLKIINQENILATLKLYPQTL